MMHNFNLHQKNIISCLMASLSAVTLFASVMTAKQVGLKLSVNLYLLLLAGMFSTVLYLYSRITQKR